MVFLGFFGWVFLGRVFYGQPCFTPLISLLLKIKLRNLRTLKGLRVGQVFRYIVSTFQCMESSLHEEHEPEMRRVPLTSLVLQIKLSKFGTPKGLLVI